MATRTDSFDLAALRLSSGEGRHLDLGVVIDAFDLGGHRYTVSRPGSDLDTATPADVLAARLDVSRMTGEGYALHVHFGAELHGPCMRCLGPAAPDFIVDAREVSQPDEDDEEEFESPYVNREATLDLAGWARDSLALALPSALLCKPDCLGLCSVCGTDLNLAGPEHVHESVPDPRWAVLSELDFTAPESSTQTPPVEG